ncbi:MAG: hypothetical protein IIB71_10310 [Proteobacteria bacterium]|nr:hypothetical protein [Pseudomonadota bacterium]
MLAEMTAREFAMDHSKMAMQAAKHMRRSKQKQKTGRVVCHHLRMMLVTELPVARSFLSGRSPKPGGKQFALGF